VRSHLCVLVLGAFDGSSLSAVALAVLPACLLRVPQARTAAAASGATDVRRTMQRLQRSTRLSGACSSASELPACLLLLPSFLPCRGFCLLPQPLSNLAQSQSTLLGPLPCPRGDAARKPVHGSSRPSAAWSPAVPLPAVAGPNQKGRSKRAAGLGPKHTDTHTGSGLLAAALLAVLLSSAAATRSPSCLTHSGRSGPLRCPGRGERICMPSLTAARPRRARHLCAQHPVGMSDRLTCACFSLECRLSVRVHAGSHAATPRWCTDCR
jgi:hypothetical protein